MLSTSFGDMAQHRMLRRQVNDLKQANTTLARELTTGLVSDTAKRVNGNAAELAGIQTTLARAGAHSDAGRSAGLFLSMQQDVLNAVRADAQASHDEFILLTSAGGAQDLANSLSMMEARFRSTVARLNTNFVDRPLFGGVAAAGNAIADPDVLLNALTTDLTSALPPNATPADISAAINDWFAPSGGFDATGYLGGPKVPARLDLGGGGSVGFDVTAQDPAIRATLATFAKGAILAQGVFPVQAAQIKDVIEQVTLDLGAARNGLVSLSAQIGSEEEMAATGLARAEAMKSSMQVAKVALLEADPYETAARLEKTMAQIELVHTLTARMSRLTLAGFLR